MVLVLAGVDRMVCHFGLPCGSFVVASRGTTLRSFLTPMGNENIPSVALGNLLTSRPGGCFERARFNFFGLRTCANFQSFKIFFRMVLLIMMIDAMGGIWTLEQPSSSIIWRHHRFQLLVKMYKASQPLQVLLFLLVLGYVYMMQLHVFFSSKIFFYIWNNDNDTQKFTYTHTRIPWYNGINDISTLLWNTSKPTP